MNGKRDKGSLREGLKARSIHQLFRPIFLFSHHILLLSFWLKIKCSLSHNTVHVFILDIPKISTEQVCCQHVWCILIDLYPKMARRWLPQPCPVLRADSSRNKFNMYLLGSLSAISVAGTGNTVVNKTDFHFCSHGDALSGKIHSQTHFSIHIKFIHTPCLLSFLEWPIDFCSGPKPLCIQGYCKWTNKFKVADGNRNEQSCEWWVVNLTRTSKNKPESI